MLIYKLTGSLMVSFLWLFNPVNNQITIWLNGRRYALSIMFLLIGFIWKPLFVPFYLLAAWMHIISVPAILLILGTKYVVFLPAMLWAFKMFIYKKHKARLMSRWNDFSKTNELQIIRPQKIILYIKTIGYYFKHIILPVPRMYHQHLSYFGRYKIANHVGYRLNAQFWFGFACTCFLFREMMTGNFWAFWFFLFISQWGNIFCVTMNIADRYCSLPGIGLMMILTKYIGRLPFTWQIIAYSAIVTVYLYKYKRMFRAYKNEESFFAYHLEIQPDCVETRTIWAQKIARNEPEKAFTLIKDGLKHRPNDFKLLLALTQIMFMIGRTKGALQVLTIAEQHIPTGEEAESKKTFQDIRDGKLRPLPVGASISQSIATPNRKARRAMKNKKKG